ncbi:MAG TPA: glycosyltransferase family 4 protein [Candidatus Limnocylindrales bacterium]|nr:glycosyltransferase family 4 protein [Candidatus Limnocylindrales bacterium]
MAAPVVFVTGVDPGLGVGGHSNYLRAHARAARRAGFEPHIVCLSAQAGTTRAPFGTVHHAQVPSRRSHLPGFKAREHQMVWRVPFLARAVAHVAEVTGARIIHGFGFYGSSGVLAARRLAGRARPVVAVTSAYDTLEREGRAKLAGITRAHGRLARWAFRVELWMNRLVVGRIERRGYAEAAQVFVNYESVRRILAESYGIVATVRNLRYASELAFTLPQAARTDGLAGVPGGTAPLIVTVSRQDPRKGLPVLLEALARLHREGVAFRACLVGGGALLEPHRRLAERLGLGGVVGLPGTVAEQWPYLVAADLFVLPSLEEGSGSLALLEAFQAGVPAVVSAVDGLLEDVTDGDNGLFALPGDAADLARVLHRALDDPALRGKLGEHARATFEARFSADALTRDLKAAYADLGVEPH